MKVETKTGITGQSLGGEGETTLPQMYEGAPWCLGIYDSFETNKPKLITLLSHDYLI